MRKITSCLVAAAAASVLASAIQTVHAAPLINVQILGSYNGGPLTANLVNVPAGGQVSFELVGQIAPVNTQNTHVTGGITSLSSADGIGSLSYNVTDSDSGVISALQLSSDFSQGSGFAAGTIAANGHSVTGARPIEANGSFAGATSQVVLETGTLTVGSLTTAETLSAVFGGTTSGAKINSGTKSLVISTTTETSSDPYVGFAPLTIAAATVPEPASMTLLCVVGGALLKRRRSTR